MPPLKYPLPAVTGSPAFAIAGHMFYATLLRRFATATISIGLTSRLWIQSCKKT